jgi:MFS family permease
MTTVVQPPVTRSRALALAVLSTTQLMVILDGTVVTVALPTIRGELGFSDAGLSWVVNSFFIAFAVVLIPAGRLGDLIGSRTVFLAGLGLFTAASAWCGLAWDDSSLVAARAVQGIGGGLSSAVVLGMVAGLFPETAARMRAFAVLAFVGSVGGSAGMVAGGLITELTSWRWVFLVNVPIGLVTLAVGLRAVPAVPGTGLRGLLPRALFDDRRFAVVNAVLLTITFAGFSFQFLSTLYLQDVLDYGPLATGLGFLTVSLVIAVVSLGYSSALAGRYGAERVLVVGMVVFAAGMLLLVRLPDDGSYLVDVAPAFVLMGIGFGLAMPQATTLAMSAVDPSYAGVASGVVTTVQQVGGALGTAAVAAFAVGADRATGYVLATAALVVGTLLAMRLQRSATRGPAASAP